MIKIILDFQYKDLMDLPLPPDRVKRHPGVSWINIFYHHAARLGWSVISSDKIANDNDINGALIISDMITKNTGILLNKGGVPFIVFTGESPNSAKQFYGNRLKKLSYKYSILFPGVAEVFNFSKNLIPFYWPNTLSDFIGRKKNFNKKKFLVMIASNKQMINRRYIFIPGAIELQVKSLLYSGYYHKLKKHGFKDLYSYRLKAIEYFSDFQDFSLYGRGWSERNSLSKSMHEKIKGLNPPEIEDKFLVLSEYQFCLCFENCVFPGYLTEKIFDCFLTGCIPVYYGAPDIEKYIPISTFIDVRNFLSFEEMNRYLRNLTAADIQLKHDAIERFLNSSDFQKFTDQYFSNFLIQSIDRHTSSAEPVPEKHDPETA